MEKFPLVLDTVGVGEPPTVYVPVDVAVYPTGSDMDVGPVKVTVPGQDT
jgi:hypothetical protein